MPAGRDALAASVLLTAAPGVAAAQPVDPSVLSELSGVARAGGSFGLVLLFGALVLARHGRLVDDAVGVSMGRPHLSFVYGCMAYGFVVFMGGLGLTQLGQIGLDDPTVLLVVAGVLSVLVLLLSGLGYAVVGAWLTGLYGPQRPWNGLVFGAALSSVGWLFLPVLPGVLLWVAVGAVGLGGPVRAWVHDERSVESHRAD
jgi:hypothetical protein